MDPALGGIIGGSLVALIAGLFALRQTRIIEGQKAEAQTKTEAIDSVRLQVEGWARLDAAHQVELARKDQTIKRLRADLAHCRQHHRERDGA